MSKPNKIDAQRRSPKFNPTQTATGQNETDQKMDAASKQARVIAMLRSSGGATISAIMHTTDWQQHSVRGFLAGVVRKRLKLKLQSTKLKGTRTYRIVGGTAPKTRGRKAKSRAA